MRGTRRGALSAQILIATIALPFVARKLLVVCIQSFSGRVSIVKKLQRKRLPHTRLKLTGLAKNIPIC
jgi:hypothetical protein